MTNLPSGYQEPASFEDVITGYEKQVESLRCQIAELKSIVRDFHWMARRYADERSSYAPSLFNRHTRACITLGVELQGARFARDGMGRNFDHLTDMEAKEAEVDMPKGMSGNIRDEEMVKLRQQLEGAGIDSRQLNAALEKAETRITLLEDKITTWIDMTVNCAGVPQNPDSLPQMLLHEFRAVLSTPADKEEEK